MFLIIDFHMTFRSPNNSIRYVISNYSEFNYILNVCVCFNVKKSSTLNCFCVQLFISEKNSLAKRTQ